MKSKNILSLFCILFFHLPFFIFGKSSYIQILDNLNAEFLYNHLLSISDNIFNINQFDKIENVINGWHLFYIHSQFKFLKLLFYLFDPFYAYVFNSLVIRIIGYYGIKLLFDKLYPNLKYKEFISIIFALLPGMVIFGSCLWGLPILAWAFLSLKDKLNLKYILVIILYVFTSTPYQYPYISLILLLYMIYLYYLDGKINKGVLLGFIIFLFLGVILDYGLLISTLTSNNEFISHRSFLKFDEVLFPSFNGIVYQYFKILIFGEFNPSHFFSLPILLLYLINLFKYGIEIRSLKTIYLIIILFIISLKIFTPQIESLDLPLVSTFGIEKKVLYFYPILFFLLLAELLKYKYSNKLIFAVLASLFFTNLIRNTEISYNFLPKNIAHLFVSEDMFFKDIMFNATSKSRFQDVDEFSNLNYDEYFSQNLFEEISFFISKEKNHYRIINVGIAPAVTLFNGFYNIDAYLSNHPKTYNEKFDKIQPNYSIKNQHLMVLKYDGFYDVCNNCTKSDSILKINLDINKSALMELNCSYIFSAFEITNFKKLDIKFLKKFEHKNSRYSIFLYEL